MGQCSASPGKPAKGVRLTLQRLSLFFVQDHAVSDVVMEQSK
jgi:hypothetical protein